MSAAASTPGAPSSGDAVVVTQDLGRRFGSLDAVRDLCLTLESGQIFGFLGPNGAGKTTTIKMLCGLVEPTRGSATVVGLDIRRERAQIKRSTGYMAQTFSLYPDLSVAENFRFFAGVYGIEGRAAARRMDELFGSVDLSELRDVPAGRLSGGMKQRLALACALVHSPRLVFLDEPTAGVDPNQRQRLWEFLYDLCEHGTSLFVTTHYLDEAERCHTVGFMLDGRLVDHGAPAELRAQLDGRLLGVEARHTVEVARAIRTIPEVVEVTIHGYELRVLFRERIDWRALEPAIRAAAQGSGVTIERVYEIAPSLEDFFLRHAVDSVRLRSPVDPLLVSPP